MVTPLQATVGGVDRHDDPRAGEETGRLSDMFAKAAAIEATKAERTVNRTVRLLEPALIVGFGAIVALVAAALLQAVYGVRVVG